MHAMRAYVLKEVPAFLILNLDFRLQSIIKAHATCKLGYEIAAKELTYVLCVFGKRYYFSSFSLKLF